ncbi:MAG: nicotinate-nucleotide--dimethylbenzimidazole phosphoribosyltransferase [Oscillospiraceae bacterium]
MLYDVLNGLQPSDKNEMARAQKRWDAIAKPLKGMGLMEDYIVKIAGIDPKIDISKKCVAVMCADNGVVAEGVTQTGSEVTAIVAQNIVNGRATVSNMSKVAGADVFVFDVGMNTTVGNGVVDKKLAMGTQNFAKVSAMTRQQAEKAIETGIEIVKELKDKGYRIIASGEMGIGNTTTSSAITSVLLDVDPQVVTGRGAGLSKEGICRKSQVIKDAVSLHKPDKNDPIDVLQKVGGYDIAAMCGLFIGGAYYKLPIIIDGLISSVAALVAYRLSPCTKDYMLASHMSAEPAADMILKELGLKAPLMCGMALGEGTGAVSIMPLLDMTVAVFKNMPTFDDAAIEEYKPL